MKKHTTDVSLDTPNADRRDFLYRAGVSTLGVGSLVLGVPLLGQESPKVTVPETNIQQFLNAKLERWALPGLYPGRVIQVTNPRCLRNDKPDPVIVQEMIKKGISALTKKNLKDSFRLFFRKEDIIGIKVNPVGPPLINTKLEVVDGIISWLIKNGIRRENIIIWDRFDYMLKTAGFTATRYPGIQIEGLQTMDEEGGRWKDPSGRHLSIDNFDQQEFYFAKGIYGRNVRGYKDDEFYLNQHVFNGEYSYFGKLLTKKLTKIINIPVFKNTGNGISMATKNIGYGSLCNTGRLHVPLFFRVCTEVLAAPVIRNKLVLNITDGLRGQYDGGPDLNAQFVYPHNSLYFSTDPFALDTICHQQLLAKRKSMNVLVNEHPRFTEYLRYAEQLKLGVTDSSKIDHLIL